MNIGSLFSHLSSDLIQSNATHLIIDSASSELIHWQCVDIQDEIISHLSASPNKIKVEILEQILTSHTYTTEDIPESEEKGASVILISTPLTSSLLAKFKLFVSSHFHASSILCTNSVVYKQLDVTFGGREAVWLKQMEPRNMYLAPDMYLLPAYSVCPAAASDSYCWGTTGPVGGVRLELAHLSTEYVQELQVVSECILRLCDELGVTGDVFSMGESSRVLGNILVSTIKERDPSEYGKRASLILVDRTLDLVTALSHSGDNLLDRICGCYPDWCEGSSDVSINMSPLFCDKHTIPSYAPGCVAQAGNERAQRLVRSMATVRPQEALLEVAATLLDGLKQLGQPSPLPQRLGRITPSHISCLIETYKRVGGEAILRNAGELQLAVASLECMEGGERSRDWDEMQSREKLLNVFLSQDQNYIREMLETQLREIISSSRSLVQLLTTILYVMLSASDDGEARETIDDIFKKEVREKIKAVESGEFLEGMPEQIIEVLQDETKSGLWLDEIMKRFKDLCSLQCKLPKHPSESTQRSPTTREPLIRDLMSTLLCWNSTVEELEYHPISFGQGFMSSLGYLMGTATGQSFKKKPGANHTVVLFLLGGVTAREIKCVADLAGKLVENHRVIVCSTRLATPGRILASIINPQH